MNTFKRLIRSLAGKPPSLVADRPFADIFEKYRHYTMIGYEDFVPNMALVQKFSSVPGIVVECGVWRGGMIAAMAEFLGPGRSYYLFDSFEGLPAPEAVDGKAAMDWSLRTEAPDYHDNCTAEMRFAAEAMQLALGTNWKQAILVKGWFEQTLPVAELADPIAILRLDGDWYASTYTCLEHLFPKVTAGGIIIIDDYHTWEGCTKAVHDYLSKNQRPEKISQFNNSLAFIVKRSKI